MRVTNNDIFNGYHAIGQMLSAGLRPKATFGISRLIKTLAPIYEEIIENKQTLLMKHAVLDAEGELIVDENQQVKFENHDKEKAFYEDIKELFNVEIDILCTPINIEDLESATRPIDSQLVLQAMAFITE
jgi:hypothetical protein